MIHHIHKTTICIDLGKTFDKISCPFLFKPTSQPTNLPLSKLGTGGTCVSLIKAPAENLQFIYSVWKDRARAHTRQSRAGPLMVLTRLHAGSPAVQRGTTKTSKDTKIGREVQLPWFSDDRYSQRKFQGMYQKTNKQKKPTQESPPRPMLV